MSSATPADVLARRRNLTLNGDADGLADLYAPDAVIESPFAGPPGASVRLEGREAPFAGQPGMPARWRAGRRSASTRGTSWRRRCGWRATTW